MMWMGLASAWGALAMAALFAVNAAVRFATGVAEWAYVAIALALAIGGFRTLRKMSGGLRLLAGAWGLAAGLLMAPLSAALQAPSSIGFGEILFVLIALIGLTLTVLHQERK